MLLDLRLVEAGALVAALQAEGRGEARLGARLCAEGLLDPAGLLAAQAVRWRAGIADLTARPPDPRLVDALGPSACLALGVLPWHRAGAQVVVATTRPEGFAALLPRLEAALGLPVAMALTSPAGLQDALRAVRGSRMQADAETRVPSDAACRGRPLRRLRRVALGGVLLSAAGALLAPVALLTVLTVWCVLMLAAGTALKLAAAIAARHARPDGAVADWPAVAAGPPPPGSPDTAPPYAEGDAAPVIARLPVVSILVALHGEDDIAPRLVRRLDRLAWPRALLDVLLAVEEDDAPTRAALAAADLPPWMRVLPVPPGRLRTKPRALNYALDFARGSIIGIYDAEDAPAPDQIHRVVRRFHARGAEVACLQGVLGYYNARTNWLTRCFAVEYATWFRLVLPGLARLGLVVPLGGTTVFFRRAALERVGAWDAANVTEDADLGLRLARRGYRTELIDSVTEEEATGRPLAWIRQRSRWIKGYAVTYATHMQHPRRLWCDLGPWRFLGVQVLFLSSLSLALLAPVLWSFWLLLFGLGHPLAGMLGLGGMVALVALFLAAEAVNIGLGLAAVSRDPGLRWLRVWVPTLHLYHPLASLAAAKALWELIARPLYWDKTVHGRLDSGAPAPVVFAGRRPRPVTPAAPAMPPTPAAARRAALARARDVVPVVAAPGPRPALFAAARAVPAPAADLSA